MAIAQKVAGYSLGQADILRRAMGKKKKSELDKQQVGFFGGMKERGYLRRRRRPCGTFCCPSPTMRSTRPTRRPTVSCPIGRPSSRLTTRRSTWPRCSPRWATTRTNSRSTSMSVDAWASRCCRQTSTTRPCTSPQSVRTSASVWEPCATSAPTSSTASSKPVGRRGIHLLHGLPRQGAQPRLQQAHDRIAHQGRRLRFAGPDSQITRRGP